MSVTVSIALAPPAVAQTFFQKLFGFGGGQAAPQALSRPPGRTIPSHRFEYRPRPYQQSRPDEADEEIGPPDSGGPYRTMCVRSCDGYFFPLRHNARRRNFASDAKSCRAACGTEARLFYYSLNGGSTETMVDLAGRRYKDLPHAFGYRKALVQGCTCKPVPWSYEEAARHRQYQEAEVAAAADKPQSLENSDSIESTAPLNDAAAKPADNASSSSQVTADVAVPQAAESYVPMRIKPEKAVVRRRKQRDARTVTRKVYYQPSSQSTSDWGIFGTSKSKY